MFRMITRALLVGILALAFAGCGGSDNKPQGKTPTQQDVDAITQELDAIKDGSGRVQEALVRLRQNIDSIKASLDQQDQASRSITRKLEQLRGGSTKAEEKSASGSGSRAAWVIVFLLFLIVILIFAIKLFQTSRVPEEPAWPEMAPADQAAGPSSAPSYGPPSGPGPGPSSSSSYFEVPPRSASPEAGAAPRTEEKKES
ncbi:MAG: hypothetical protein NTX50_14570 [Candidatus Sumerlaeota bacterium]|nr:hypothetical protein [Candidatus Sumerlaeota bacterium]